MLGLRADACFERFGRFGPYGLGYEVGGGGSSKEVDTGGENNAAVLLQRDEINNLAFNHPDSLDWSTAQN